MSLQEDYVNVPREFKTDDKNVSNPALKEDTNVENSPAGSNSKTATKLRLNWSSKISDVLNKNNIETDASNWILEHFCEWENLEGLRKRGDLLPNKVEILEMELLDIFGQFIIDRDSFVESLKTHGVLSNSIINSRLLFYFASGIESMQTFLNSSEVVPFFGKEEVETIETIFHGMKKDQSKTPKTEQMLEDVEQILTELQQDQDTKEKIMNTFSSCEDFESGLAECENISTTQRALTAEKLKAVLGTEKISNDTQTHYLSDESFHSHQLLQQSTDLDEDSKSSDDSLTAVDDLEKCIGLDEVQLELPPNAPEESLPQSSNAVETGNEDKVESLIQQPISDMDRNEVETEENPGPQNNVGDGETITTTAADSLENEQELVVAASDVENPWSIIPLILCHTALEEGFSVNKFTLAEEAVNYICQSVPDEMMGGTPIIYESFSNGTIIDFETLDQLSISCVGLFGPLKATMEYIQSYGSIDGVSMLQLKESLRSQSCGIFLIDSSKLLQCKCRV